MLFGDRRRDNPLVPVDVGAGSWVSVAAFMVIGPVELGGSSWAEVPGESVAPVLVVLPTGSVVELTTWFELSAG